MIQQAAWDWAFLQDYLRFFITGVTILVRFGCGWVCSMCEQALVVNTRDGVNLPLWFITGVTILVRLCYGVGVQHVSMHRLWMRVLLCL